MYACVLCVCVCVCVGDVLSLSNTRYCLRCQRYMQEKKESRYEYCFIFIFPDFVRIDDPKSNSMSLGETRVGGQQQTAKQKSFHISISRTS